MKNFQVLEGDGLPPYICQKCISKLNIAFQFKSQCESSDAKLRQCFENFHHLPATPDLTGFMELKKDDTNANTTVTFPENIETNNCQLQAQDMQQVADVTLPDNNQMQETTLLTTVQIEPGPSLNDIDKNTLTDLKIELSDLKPVDLDLKVRFCCKYVIYLIFSEYYKFC